MIDMKFFNKRETFSLQIEKEQGEWLYKFLPLIATDAADLMTFKKLKEDFETSLGLDFEPFWYGKAINTLRQNNLLVL